MFPRDGLQIHPRNTESPSYEAGFHATLLDGTPVRLRPVTAADKWRIEEGLSRMSPGSIYHRFCRNVAALSSRELRYLTEVDQVRHIAWGAVDPEDPEERGLGVARLVRDTEIASRAEGAVTVIDPYRGVGLGTLLLATLCALGRRQGIRTFRACILPENQRVIDWFRRLGARTVQEDPTLILLDLDLSEPAWRLTSPAFSGLIRSIESLQPDGQSKIE